MSTDKGCNGGRCERFDLGAEPCTNCEFVDENGDFRPIRKIESGESDKRKIQA